MVQYFKKFTLSFSSSSLFHLPASLLPVSIDFFPSKSLIYLPHSHKTNVKCRGSSYSRPFENSRVHFTSHWTLNDAQFGRVMRMNFSSALFEPNIATFINRVHRVTWPPQVASKRARMGKIRPPENWPGPLPGEKCEFTWHGVKFVCVCVCEPDVKLKFGQKQFTSSFDSLQRRLKFADVNWSSVQM